MKITKMVSFTHKTYYLLRSDKNKLHRLCPFNSEQLNYIEQHELSQVNKKSILNSVENGSEISNNMDKFYKLNTNSHNYFVHDYNDLIDDFYTVYYNKAIEKKRLKFMDSRQF